MLAAERLTAVPAPESVAVCGEPAAPSATLTIALCNPVAAGLKVTAITQEAAAAMLVPQVLVWLYEAAPAPVMLMPVTGIAVVPLLLSVRFLAADATPIGVVTKPIPV